MARILLQIKIEKTWIYINKKELSSIHLYYLILGMTLFIIQNQRSISSAPHYNNFRIR